VFIKIARNRQDLGKFASDLAAKTLREVLKRQSRARMVVATGASQFEVLASLTREPGIDWERVDGFHLDEYLGIARSHPASFCGYLAERFVNLVPIGSFHFLDGTAPPADTIRKATLAWQEAPIDIAMIGIGENGHLAFNDPPADFSTREIYHIVDLDHACRQQQVGEGWFSNFEACPSKAISMTIFGILRSARIICSVPDERKAQAVANSLDGPLTSMVPGSMLRQHSDVTLVLDDASASRLSEASVNEAERV
jgi:glucosamine-6-phosphate deaminase